MHVSNNLPEAAGKRTFPFTKPTVAKMACLLGRTETFYWDKNCRGLGVRCLESGKRSWVFQYRDAGGHTRRMGVGDLTVIDLDTAREAARRHAANLIQGGNPSVERGQARRALRIGDAVEDYLKYAKNKQRARSYRETERYLRRHAKALHSEHIDTVPRHVIATLLDRAAGRHGPVAANRMRAHLSAFFTWAIMTGRSTREANPVAFTIQHREVPKSRVLSDDELQAVWKATGGTCPYDRIVRLCLLTGCRRDEIGGMQWSEIGNEWITIPADRMKGKAAHEVELLPAIAACLPPRPADGGTGAVFSQVGAFNGFCHGKLRLDAKLAKAGHHLAAWGLHDMRRTLSTRLHDAGAPPIAIEALLAHKQQGVAGIYNRASFREAKREALATWHKLLGEIVGGTLGGGYLFEVSGRAA
jgi:integrase